MKAVRIHRYGGREVLRYEDAPLPEIAAGEVLIRVVAAAVNPVDWKIREGYLKDRLDHTFPLTLGWDVAGIVDAVGPAVHTLSPGDAVYARPDLARNGTCAEYVAVRAEEVAFKPWTLSFMSAAGLPLAGITAWEAVFSAGGLAPGQTILIHAAAGGVGSLAVQLAKWRGARVIGTASGPNRPFVLPWVPTSSSTTATTPSPPGPARPTSSSTPSAGPPWRIPGRSSSPAGPWSR